jgi:hypothetical protein
MRSTLFLACLWEIWKYRNAIIFREVRLTTEIVGEKDNTRGRSMVQILLNNAEYKFDIFVCSTMYVVYSRQM